MELQPKQQLSNKLFYPIHYNPGPLCRAVPSTTNSTMIPCIIILHCNCKDPSLLKENKASSRAEDDAKSVEVGTHEAGHQSDLSGGQSSARVGEILINKV